MQSDGALLREIRGTKNDPLYDLTSLGGQSHHSPTLALRSNSSSTQSAVARAMGRSSTHRSALASRFISPGKRRAQCSRYEGGTQIPTPFRLRRSNHGANERTASFTEWYRIVIEPVSSWRTVLRWNRLTALRGSAWARNHEISQGTNL